MVVVVATARVGMEGGRCAMKKRRELGIKSIQSPLGWKNPTCHASQSQWRMHKCILNLVYVKIIHSQVPLFMMVIAFIRGVSMIMISLRRFSQLACNRFYHWLLSYVLLSILLTPKRYHGLVIIIILIMCFYYGRFDNESWAITMGHRGLHSTHLNFGSNLQWSIQFLHLTCLII